MKIAIISCYRDPDYIRAQVLRQCLAADKRVELIVIKNKYKNVLRYPEVLGKIIWTRMRQRPDVYLLTMRAEILPLLQILAWPHPVVYDEMVNFIEWFVYEHQYVKPRGEMARILATLYTSWLRRCELILADTIAHGAHSAALSGVSHSIYRTIPVGTDEEVFNLSGRVKAKTSGKFEVIFVGNLKPMYGLPHVLEAAVALKDNTDIRFVIAGGGDKKNVLGAVHAAQANGARITYRLWISFKDLPKTMRHADLCLAGQFGNTEQSKLVITGKTYQMLALGLPVVIGRSHASEAFTDKDDCLLVTQGDSKALATAIEWAYTNRKKLDKIGLNGRKLYDKKFSNEVIAKKLSALVDELAKTLADRAHARSAR